MFVFFVYFSIDIQKNSVNRRDYNRRIPFYLNSCVFLFFLWVFLLHKLYYKKYLYSINKNHKETMYYYQSFLRWLSSIASEMTSPTVDNFIPSDLNAFFKQENFF